VIFIMQEALANVRKHSKASQVLINIEYGAQFKLSVIDNGIGINQDILKKRSKRHVGLNIMGERAQRIGAKVTVGAVAPEVFQSGTCVELVISDQAQEDRSSLRTSAAAASED
jgi:two-component system nitrate/nitrite sensor histidine kinase NarX